MNSHRVAYLSFKLLGLWLLVQAAVGAASMPYIWQSSPNEAKGATAAMLSLPWLVSLGIGAPVWFSADWFAAHVFPGARADSDAARTLRVEPVFAVGTALIGLLLLSQGFPSLASAAYLFGRSLEVGVLGPDETRRQLLWDVQAKASALEGVIRVGLGAALLAGPARFATLVSRLRRDFSGSLVDDPSNDRRTD
jgi:hypothetical protein